MKLWKLEKFAQISMNLGGGGSMGAAMPEQMAQAAIGAPGGPANNTDAQQMQFIARLSPQVKTMANQLTTMTDKDRQDFGYVLQMLQKDKNYITKYETMIKNVGGKK